MGELEKSAWISEYEITDKYLAFLERKAKGPIDVDVIAEGATAEYMQFHGDHRSMTAKGPSYVVVDAADRRVLCLVPVGKVIWLGGEPDDPQERYEARWRNTN